MKEWIEPTGAVISSIGTNGFAKALMNSLHAITKFDYIVVFGYQGTAAPLDLFDTFPEGKRKIFVEDYQEGPYLLDPFYLAATTGTPPGLYRLKEIAPDRFYQGEYFRSYYKQTGLAEEIGFLIDLSGPEKVVVSLMRADKPFSVKDFRELKSFWPIIEAAVKQHWSQLIDAFGGFEDDKGFPENKSNIELAFSKFGDGFLTPREREVVEYTLKGHSADAVGRILGIAAGTVRIHRKNIYAKLRIGTQGELFSKFIATLTDGRG